MEPTAIQTKVFDFVRGELAEGRPAPTLREIAATFGWQSKRAAERHVEALVRQGFLAATPGKARSLRPVSHAQGQEPTQERPAFARIPIFGSIPAGFGDDREQENEECVTVSVDSVGFTPTRNTFALRVKGDSMIGKHICDGDVVVLEHGPEPRSGQIVAALIDRKTTLKTFMLKNGRPFLRAENPKYPNLIPSDELVIQGVFRVLIRKAKE